MRESATSSFNVHLYWRMCFFLGGREVDFRERFTTSGESDTLSGKVYHFRGESDTLSGKVIHFRGKCITFGGKVYHFRGKCITFGESDKLSGGK